VSLEPESRCCSPIWQNPPYIYLFLRLPLGLAPTHPVFLPYRHHGGIFTTGIHVATVFSGHDHPEFSNRDGTSFEKRRANSWSFLPFLYPLSLPPRLTRPTLASHTNNNIHADDTVAATSSLGPAFKCANEGDLLSGSQVHRGLNPAVLEPISAPFALALASVT